MLQKTISTSRLTLPLTALYGIVICLLAGVVQKELWWQTLCLAINTYLVLILNNRFSIIRIYSRLMSGSFLVLSLMATFLLPSMKGAIVQLLFVLHLIFLFELYQKRNAAGLTFYAFLCLGGISTQFVQMLFFVPVVWFLMPTRLQSWSLKNFLASLFGIIVPYWFWGAYEFWHGTPEVLLNHITGIAHFGNIFAGLLEPHLLITTLFLAILASVGATHFLRYSYQDNIKTRLLFHVFIAYGTLAVIFILLQPQHSDYLIRIIITCAAPLVAHLFTFTRTKISNWFFIATIVAIIALTAYNIWSL